MNEPRYVTVYCKPDRYAGWPANQGIWIWGGEEILVGFVLGYHAKERSDWKYGHPIDQTRSQEHVFSRSLDGGETWGTWGGIDYGRCCGRHRVTYDHFCVQAGSILPGSGQALLDVKEPMDFLHKDFALSFVRETNHTGPTHFYQSCNRGRSWFGPHPFPDLGTPGVASRTDYVVVAQRELVAMPTVAKPDGREGRVLCASTINGGLDWQRRGWVGELDRDGFAIMPATVRLDENRLLTVVRRSCRGEWGPSRNWLEAYLSRNMGYDWEHVGDPVENTGRNGSPAALAKLADGRLCLAYVVRGKGENTSSRLCVKLCDARGLSWGPEIVLRDDGKRWDLGYPRIVQRSDGCMVVVYYWANAERWPTRWIGATIWKPD